MTRYSKGAAARADKELSNIIAFDRETMIKFMAPKFDFITGSWTVDEHRKKPLRRGAPKGFATVINGYGTHTDRNGDEIRVYTSFMADQRKPKYHGDALRAHRAEWGCGKLKKGTPAYAARQAQIASLKSPSRDWRKAA